MKAARAVFYAEITLLILVMFYDFRMISTYGSSWDNIAAYFNGLTMIGQSHYYEALREPLIQLLVVPVLLVTRNFITVTDVLTLLLGALFFLAVRKLAKALRVNGISAYLMALSSVVVGFATLLNATDILAIITLTVAIAYYYEGKRTESALFFGLSFLAKFTNLIFVFYMPFIFRGRDLAKALAIELAVNTPWLLANYLAYGNPVYGYMQAIGAFASYHTFSLASIASAVVAAAILTYPFIIALAIVFLAHLAWQSRKRLKALGSRIDIRDYGLLLVALLEFFYVGSAQDYIAWLGYPLYVAFLVIALKEFGRLGDRRTVNLINTANVLGCFAVIVFSMASASMLYGPYTAKPVWFSNNPAYNQSLNVAYSYGCNSIYSNVWPYLMVYNHGVNSIFQDVPTGACAIVFLSPNPGVAVNLSGNYTTVASYANFSVRRRG